MTNSDIVKQVVLVGIYGLLLFGCGREATDSRPRARGSDQARKSAAETAYANRAMRRAATQEPVNTPSPTPQPEKRVTLTTTTTLRDLAAELTKQLGIEYAADDEIANTTIAVELNNATRAEVETVIREKAKVRMIYSDRDVPEQWVHFAPEF